MKRIVVTGGSGKLGNWVIKDLLAHGYEVTSADRRDAGLGLCPFMAVDLNRLDEAERMLEHADGLVHLAAIPAPRIVPDDETFANNGQSTFNVLEASDRRGLKKVVIGSSESIYGFVYGKYAFDPLYLPIDELHRPLPQDCYGLSKIVNEATAEMFHRRSGMQVVSLRFAWIATEQEYVYFRGKDDIAQAMKRNMWSYVDIRDAAAACRLGLEAEGVGAAAYNITSDTTMMEIDSIALISEHYPGVTDIREPLTGSAALYSNRRAKEQLGWKPEYGIGL